MQVREPLPVALVNASGFDSWAAVLAWYARWSARPATAFESPSAGVAGHALAELRRLRDALRIALDANAARSATTRALAPLNALIDAHLAVRASLAAANGRVVSARSSTGHDGPALLLSEIALAIVDLFGSARGSRVKQCAHEACSRFFLDESKSGTRTWCSMKTCGNRVKAARYYERTKS
jgi:predicted RNA-binding Zn ribbon-like protein